jgi:pimeloyl-ACP methyl ester carboxylesterase
MIVFTAFAVAGGLVGFSQWSSQHAANAQNSAKPSPTRSISTGVPALDVYYNQVLQWKDCNDGFDCSSLQVPLDYKRPGGVAISLSLIRLKAKNAVGSLLLNPGGPGGSGIDYVRAATYVVSPNLISNFDIVGFDPRGVGKSTPVHCLSGARTDAMIAADGSPDNQAEIDRLVALNKEFAAGCQKKSPDLYRFVDTVSAARDIDVLRNALGDRKLNWLGKSYGTFLGATYAELFPKRVGRMVLDGVVDPALTNTEISHGQAIGFEKALHRFITDCFTHSDCPLTGSPQNGFGQISNLLTQLDSNPAKLADGRTLTQAMALIGVLGSLYDKQYGWSHLRSDLSAAFKSSFGPLASSLDSYISRGPDGKYLDNSNDAIAAVNCLDRPDRPSIKQTQQLVKQWRKDAPLFGDYLAWSDFSCTYWKTPATGKPHGIVSPGSSKILVVGTLNDPATPYAWSKNLTKQLSDATLLTFDGDGHTAYMQGSKCIDQVVDNYFLTGTAKAGVVCHDGP